MFENVPAQLKQIEKRGEARKLHFRYTVYK